jgi:hypothetical protein
VTIGPEDDGENGCGARDRITPVETHRSGTQNKTEKTQPEKTKTTEDLRKQPEPNQQHTGSFMPENKREKPKKAKKKLPNPEESEELGHGERLMPNCPSWTLKVLKCPPNNLPIIFFFFSFFNNKENLHCRERNLIGDYTRPIQILNY